LLDIGLIAEIEQRLDLGLLGAGADDLRLGLAAQDELERLDQDRFAGAGLTGHHVHAGAELDLELVDNREVTHAKAGQHGSAPDFVFR
jgi:hypothetical protein